MTTQNKNVPSLRFPEFNEDWNLTKLGEVADVKRGAASQHLNYVNSAQEGIRLLRINDFLNNDAVYILDTEDIKRFRVKTNDILIAGTGATAGIVFIIPEEFNDLAFSYNAPRIRVSKANHSFILFYLKSDLILKQQKSLFVGNAQHFLDTDAMRGFKINLPTIPEQQKIAAFLMAVDEKIQQLAKKKNLLEQYKKGVMQKIFNQEIRFKDDSGNDFANWEEMKLSEIAVKIQDGTHFSPNTSETGDFLYLTSKNVKNGYIDLSNAQYIDEKSHNDIYKRCDVKFGDVLITKDGTIGQICVNELSEPFSLLSSVAFIRPNQLANNYFIYHLLTSPIGQKEIDGFIAGQALKRITLTKINNFKFKLPCIEEQIKIANFLSAIDEKIKTTTQQLKKTKEYKKGLLQQMFI